MIFLDSGNNVWAGTVGEGLSLSMAEISTAQSVREELWWDSDLLVFLVNRLYTAPILFFCQRVRVRVRVLPIKVHTPPFAPNGL